MKVFNIVELKDTGFPHTRQSELHVPVAEQDMEPLRLRRAFLNSLIHGGAILIDLGSFVQASGNHRMFQAVEACPAPTSASMERTQRLMWWLISSMTLRKGSLPNFSTVPFCSSEGF